MTKTYRTTKQMVAVLLETCDLTVTQLVDCKAIWTTRKTGVVRGQGCGKTHAMALRRACETAWDNSCPQSV